MKPLTQEQAERCFHACDGTNPRTPGCIVEEYALPDGYHTFILPLDPYFWFPRLWENLRQQWLYHVVPILMHETLAEDCFSLCAAIESIDKEKKE